MSDDINYKINITNNPAGVQQAAAGLVKVEQEAADLRSQFSSVEKAAVRASKAVANVGDAKPIRQATSEIKRAEAAMRDYGAAAKQARDEVKSFADFKANVGQLSGALNFAGLGGASSGLGIAQQSAASVEALGKIAPALGEMSQKATAAVPALGSMAGGISKLAPGLSASGASMAALGVVGLAAGAVIGVTALALSKYNSKLQETADKIRAETEARRALEGELASGVLTTAEITRRQDELNKRYELTSQRLADAQDDYDAYIVRAGNSIQRGLRQIFDPTEQALADAVNTAADDLDTITAEIDALGAASDIAALSVNDMAEAQQRLQGYAEEYGAVIASQTLAVLTAQRQTTDAINSQIQSLEDQKTALQDQIAFQESVGASVDDLLIKYDDLTNLQRRLADEALPLARAQERAAETAEKAAEAQEELARQQAETTDMLIAATEKYNSDVERINQQTYQKLAALQENYNQAQINAAQKLVDDQTKITERLADTVAKLAQEASKADADARRNLELNRAKELLNFQRAEQDAARDHLRRMQQIRKDAEASEEEAILNRDFRALFQIRKRTTEQLKTETENFGEERRKRSEQIQQRLGDMAAEFAQEQAQRHQEYQQRLADAKAQADKERQQVDADNKAALDKLSAHFQAQQSLIKRQQEQEIASRNKAIESELQVISQGYERRLQIERQYQERMIQQAQSILSRSGGLVGANGGSSLSGAAGNRYNSVVNNNASMNNSFAINSSNPTVTSQQISNVLMAQLSDIFGP